MEKSKSSYPQRCDSTFRNRFFLTLVLLLAAALLNATVPNFFAAAVDVFSGGPAWAVAPATILAAYVFTYWLSKMFNEARWMLYGPIEQRAQRTLALRSSQHLIGVSPQPQHRRNQPRHGQRA